VLTFGLASVPVGLYSATEAHEPAFHQFEKGASDAFAIGESTSAQVRRSITRTSKAPTWAAGTTCSWGNDELDEVATGRSWSMDIHRFVKRGDIDPIYFNKTYFLGPQLDEARKTYLLLRDAMARSDQGDRNFVMRGKEDLAAVRADGDLLVLETMFFADEVRDECGHLKWPRLGVVFFTDSGPARVVIGPMSGRWRPSECRDTYTDRVNDSSTPRRMTMSFSRQTRRLRQPMW
jgi:DNA end-binding protein Ku